MNAASETEGIVEARALEAHAREWAGKAETVHKQVEAHDVHLAALGRQQLESVIQAGQHLLKAKEVVGHGHFEKAFTTWVAENVVTFSGRSRRRYMLLAQHAEEIKSANLANLNEAEKYVAALKPKKRKAAAVDDHAAPPSGGEPPDPVEQCEAHVLNNMRRLQPTQQRSFLEALITKLNERLENLSDE